MSTPLKLMLLLVFVFVVCGVLFNLLFGDPYTLKSLAKDTLSGIAIALIITFFNKTTRKPSNDKTPD